MAKKILVTGGAGFIGSHVVGALLKAGACVTVVDNLSTGARSNLPKHKCLKLIIKDVLACSTKDLKGPFDGAAHLAGTPSVQMSWRAPVKAHEDNLTTTVHVINLCRELKIKRLVLASSAAVYGNTAVLPIREETNTQPLSPYGLQKLAGEQYGKLFASSKGLAVIALRLFNVFGPRQNPGSPYSGVISIFCERMRKGQPILVYGSGRQTRDYVYVEDVANAFMKALNAPIKGNAFAAVNIASGRGISLNELIGVLRSCCPSWKTDIQYLPARAGDIRHSTASVTKAKRLLGFKCRHDVRSGLKKLVNDCG